jgi:hypothetical protein
VNTKPKIIKNDRPDSNPKRSKMKHVDGDNVSVLISRLKFCVAAIPRNNGDGENAKWRTRAI